MRLFEDLLQRVLNGPMLYASGAPAVGGGDGGGGGAGGGTEGGGGASKPIATWGPPSKGGKTGAVDTGRRDGGDDREGTEEAEDTEHGDFSDLFEEGEGTGESQEAQGAQTFKEFVEEITTNLSSGDEKLTKQAEKSLKKLYGENTRYKETFESPEQARELVDRIEALGGLEGIETETQEAATLWNMLGAGDPAILDTLAEEHGEGLEKLFDPFVDRMAKVNPAAYAHKFAKIFMTTLNEAEAGKISALAALNQLMSIEGVKDSEAFQTVAEAINKVNEIARRAPERKGDDPKTSKKEKELLAREADLKRQSLAGRAAPILRSSAKSAVGTILNGRKIPAEGMKQVLDWTQDAFAKLTEKDTVGKRNRADLLAAGETEKWLKHVKTTANRFMKQAAKIALRKYAGISGLRKQNADQRRAEGDSRREAGGGGQSGGTIRAKGAPDPKTVDWERMKHEAAKLGFKDSDDMFMFGRTFFRKGDQRNTYKF